MGIYKIPRRKHCATIVGYDFSVMIPIEGKQKQKTQEWLRLHLPEKTVSRGGNQSNEILTME